MTRIAVIDDDQPILDLMQELFREQGWDAILHTDARTAVQMVQQEHPDAVLLDLWLDSAVTGWQILTQLKADPSTSGIPVIILSGAVGELESRASWLAEHGVPVLAKPFTLDELYETIEAALQRDALLPN